MASRRKPQTERDWYSVSISAVRRAVLLLVLVLLGIAGSLAYQRWEQATLEDRAQLAIERSSQLIRSLEGRDDFEEIQAESADAWEDLDSARAEFSAGRFRQALDRARRSQGELERVAATDPNQSQEKIRFERVQGGVEYRRGDRGSWRRARVHDSLNFGDWIKTSSDGSAEIRFPDRSKYVLRRSTMVHLGRTRGATGANEQVTDIVFGWVEFNTTQSGGRVKTPKSEASVRSDSEALVSYDRDGDQGQFASFRGGLDVTSSSGQVKRLGALQKVSQVGESLSEPVALPARPRLVSPGAEAQIRFREGQPMSLQWRPVANAASYSLRVARSPLFTKNLIEDTARRKTSARLGMRGPGSFYWQVAAVSRDGSPGPWSEPRQFRIAHQTSGDADDETPPELEIEQIQTYGRMVLVSGSTEADAIVKVNNEAATVESNGFFSKTIQMKQEGFTFIEVTAADARENVTKSEHRVFIDAF